MIWSRQSGEGTCRFDDASVRTSDTGSVDGGFRGAVAQALSMQAMANDRATRPKCSSLLDMRHPGGGAVDAADGVVKCDACTAIGAALHRNRTPLFHTVKPLCNALWTRWSA
jgi:hypothetical protein